MARPMGTFRRAGQIMAAAAATWGALASGAHALDRGTLRNLECRDIRRLSDNYLLDLRIRMIFSRARHSYVRLENAGRGWQYVDRRPYLAVEPTRILLADNPYFKSYIERLTGDYYHIDLTNTGLSVWGRCTLAPGTDRLF